MGWSLAILALTLPFFRVMPSRYPDSPTATIVSFLRASSYPAIPASQCFPSRAALMLLAYFPAALRARSLGSFLGLTE
ncbi:hypothetical protein ES705_48526 [subsurface metagenome]